MCHIIIAIDGTSGVGKSTIATAISKHYHIPCLNSGAMFRTLAYKAMQILPEKHFTTLEMSELEQVLSDSHFSLLFQEEQSHLYCNGNPIPNDIYTERVAKVTAHIASFPEIRVYLRSMQQKIGESTSLVAEGRDIGTVVFPNASIKLFLTACPKERAKRRYNELQNKYPETTYSTVLQQLQERDEKDIHRSESPLIPAEDAHIIDTTLHSLEEVFEQVRDFIDRKKLFPEDTHYN